MALSAKVGAETTATSATTKATTGVGFQPNALLVINTHQTSTGTAVDAANGFGATSGSTAARNQGFCVLAPDAQSSTTNYQARSLSNHLVVQNATETAIKGALSAFGADGFTENYAVATGTAYQFHYLALAGASNVYAGSFTGPTTATTKAVTGLGFQPDFLILFGSTQLTTDELFDNNTNNRPFVGFCNATQQAVFANTNMSAVSTTDTYRYQRTDRCLSIIGTSGVISWSASWSSFDADGFTLSFDTSAGAAHDFHFIAFKGVASNIQAITQPTATASQTVTVPQVTPKAVILCSVGAAASTSVGAGAEWSMGFSDGTSQSAIWSGATDNSADSICDQASSTAKLGLLYAEGTPTLVTDVAIASFANEQVALNWTTYDGTARSLILVTLGDAAVIETPTAGSWQFVGGTATPSVAAVSAPTAGALAFVGGTPTTAVEGGETLSVTPTAGALTYVGGTATTQVAAQPSPSAGSLQFVGGTPTATRAAVSAPTVGTLVLVGGTGTAQVAAVAAPSAGTLVYAAGTPSAEVAARPAPSTGSLVYVGGTPTSTQTALSTPTAGALVYAGATPTASVGVMAAPTAGALVVVGGTPSTAVAAVCAPTAGVLTYAGLTPLATSACVVTPTAGVLQVLGGTPTTTVQQVAAPTAGAVVYAGGTPVCVVTWVVTPSAGTWQWTGGTPVASQGLAVTPTAGVVQWTGGTPTATVAALAAPTVGSVILLGATPTATVASVSLPTAGTLTYTGATPTAVTATQSAPTAGVLAFAPATPTTAPAWDQVVAPIADVAAGGWTPSTGSDLWAVLDETEADDGDYARSGATPSDDTAVVTVGSLDVPEAGAVSVIVRVRLAA